MFKTLRCNIKGIVPSLQNNGQMANPLNPIAKEHSRVSGKRKKTEADHALLSQIGWIGAAYTTEPGSFKIAKGELTPLGFGKLCWPGKNIKAMLISAGKIKRLGKQLQAGLFSLDNWPVQCNGSVPTVEAAFKDKKFWNIQMVRIQRNSVLCTRVLTPDWSLTFDILYEADILDSETIRDVLEIAGTRVGLSDYRPEYGRFTVEGVEEVT